MRAKCIILKKNVSNCQRNLGKYVKLKVVHRISLRGKQVFLLPQRPNENWSDEQLAELALRSEKLQTLQLSVMRNTKEN